MKAYLLAVFSNVVAPASLTRSFIEGIENTGARTNEDGIVRDRGD